MLLPVWTSNVTSFDPIDNHSLKFTLFKDLLPVVNCAGIPSIGTGQWKRVSPY